MLKQLIMCKNYGRGIMIENKKKLSSQDSTRDINLASKHANIPDNTLTAKYENTRNVMKFLKLNKTDI